MTTDKMTREDAFAAGAEAMRLAILDHLVATLPYPQGEYASALRGGIRALPQPRFHPAKETRPYGD